MYLKRKATNTHFLLESRLIIENRLNEQYSISDISRELGRNKSSIMREIKRHSKYSFPSIFNNYHPCTKSSTCPVKQIDCYLTCKNIEISLCKKLISSPHVCNPCCSKKGCRHVKIYYKASEANEEYIFRWSSDRKNLHYSKEELLILNTDFKATFFKNRSIYHTIRIFNKKGFHFNAVSIYRQIKQKTIDIPIEWLPRQRKSSSSIPDRSYKRGNIEGHTFEDYLSFLEKNPNASEMQMDTVEGIKNGNQSYILTLQIVKIKFLFIFKLEAKTFEEVLQKLKYFRNIIGEQTFNNLFQILLTDNGVEFGNIERFTQTFKTVNLFYCHPYSSYEKGNIENNHELIRKVIPKGISLNPYTQADYNLLASHINSLYRKSLDGSCPFDFIENYISKETLQKLGIFKIQEEGVIQNPYLLGNKNIENIKKYLDNEDIRKANLFL